MNLPRYTYSLLFLHRDGSTELFEHTTEDEARKHLALFGIEDADIYTRIDLFQTDWEATPLRNTRLDGITFPA